MENNTKVDALQEELLKKLTEYGDSVLEARFRSGKKTKKRKMNYDPQTHVTNNDDKSKIKVVIPHSNEVVDKAEMHLCNNEPKKKKRKKKKKGGNVDSFIVKDEKEESEAEHKKSVIAGPKKHMEGIVGELGLKQFKCDLQKQGTSGISGSRTETIKKKEDKREPDVIVFTSHKDRKPKEKHKPLARQKTVAAEDFDMKQARFEVRKFGLAGFHGDEKEKAMTDLLLRLGAKPKKKAYINYRELQEKRKEEMMSENEKREQDRHQGLKGGKKKNRKRPRDRNDIGSVDGQVGKFVKGVQMIKPNDVQGIRKSKLKIK